MTSPFVSKRPPFTNILVAVDESEQAGWATEYAVRVAKQVLAKVSLVHVVSTPLGEIAGAFAESALLQVAADTDPVLQAARNQVPEELFDQEILCQGEAALAIVETAQKIKADLVVIGTHGRGTLGRFLLGSTAEAVVRRAPCPVLTISRPPGEQTLASLEKPEPYDMALPGN